MSAGRVVRRGRIRVDARKAMAKLREHLLVDLHLYAVEVVRAAALAGARRVDVQYDADDVVITFDGRPLEAAELPRLFEHLTGDGGDETSRRQRLLALAVNAALGLDPAWVSLTTASDGVAARVTWSPALVAAIEREEKQLPEPEVMTLPAGMPGTGTRFHFHRKVGWEVVRRAAAKTAPREIALLATAARNARELRAEMLVNGQPLAPSNRPRALATASLSLPGASAAHLEIVAATTVAPHVELCELGLLLSRTSFALGRHFPMAEHLGVVPPVRVVVDADALPTNASRSAVREDAPLLGALASAAAPALADALAGIAATLFKRGSVPEGVRVDGSDPGALADALGAFLCAAEASLVGRVAMPEALRALFDLPLFCDGLGRPLTYAKIPGQEPLPVWNSEGPVPEELSPWAGHLVWRRGRVAERVLSTRRCMDPQELAERAKRGAARRRKLLAMPAQQAAVPQGAYLALEMFKHSEGPLAGLSGEVAITDPSSDYVRNLALRLFIEGRCFEAFPLDERAVPLDCVIALEWPGHITPKFAYEGIESTQGLNAALAIGVRQGVLLCERFAAERAATGRPFDATCAGPLRAALATAVLAPSRMYSAQGFEMPGLAELPALVSAAIWPTSDGGFVSLGALAEYAARTGAVCVAAPGTSGRAADGRPVVCGPSREIEWLSACLHPSVAIVRYDAALAMTSAPHGNRPARESLIAFANATARAHDAPILFAEAEGYTYAVTLGASEARVWHGGAPLSPTGLDDALGGVTVAVDDDSIVPTTTWDGVLYARDKAIAGRAERAFAERLVAALLGDSAAREKLFQALGPAAARYRFPDDLAHLSPAVQRYLIDRAARGRLGDAAAEDRELSSRFELVPFLSMIGDSGAAMRVGLGYLARAHPLPGQIPWLRAAPSFQPVHWRPLIVADESVIAALGRWCGGRLRDGTLDLPEQQTKAERASQYALFQGKPRLDPEVVGENGDPASPSLVLPAAPKHGVHGVAVALPRPDFAITRAWGEVLFEDRLVCEMHFGEVQAPVVARVQVVGRLSLDGFDRLSSYGAGGVSARLGQAASELALKLLERAQQPGSSHTFFGEPRVLRLVLGLLAEAKPDPRIGEMLCGGALLWPTVQGTPQPYPKLCFVDGALWVGTTVYPSWLPSKGPPSDLDRPILHLAASPEGELLGSLLTRLGLKTRNVSEALGSLQGTRAQGSAQKPRLAARPSHPSLACDLEALGVVEMQGEIGIYDAGSSVAEISAPGGDTRRVPLETGFPVCAVVRVEVLTESAAPLVADKLVRAAVRLLLGLIPSLDKLPPFVRAHLRALICRALSKEKDPPKVAAAAAVFPDIDGGFWSLKDLRSEALGDLSCTFDPPPYAKARQAGRTLALSPAEHLQIHRRIKILNVTDWMRRDLVAERRREAPPVERICLEDVSRSQMLTSFTVKEGSLEGEIGLLQPTAEEGRGIKVHVTRRPVCTLDDRPGWPIAAVVNDDTRHPSRWFDALLPAEESALRSRLRALATRHMESWLQGMIPVEGRRLGAAFIDEALPPMAAYGSTEPLHVTGYVFLPHVWPVVPAFRLWVQGSKESSEQPLELATALIDPFVPGCGALFVAHGAATFTRGAGCRLALAIRGVLERLLAPLLKQAPDDPTLQMYAWNLRLIGSTAGSAPSAIAADGRLLGAEDVLGALAAQREIWLTDRRGSLEGAFPGEAPPFVLPDDASPLVKVLRARLGRDRIKLLGAPPPEKVQIALAPRSLPPPPGEEVPLATAASAAHPASRSWLGQMLARVTALFAERPPEEKDPSSLAAAVERTLRALRLRDEPVIHVHEVRKGRLVRYAKQGRVVFINVAHPALARHAAATSQSAMRRACIALVAAALSEVNIALLNVTDSDEEQALLELLRQEAAAGAAPGT